MLNYIWLGLIVIAILVATGRDIVEMSQDRFRNNQALTLQVDPGSWQQTSPNKFSGTAYATKQALAGFYGNKEVANLKSNTVRVPVNVVANTVTQQQVRGTVKAELAGEAPKVWGDMATTDDDKKLLTGDATFVPDAIGGGALTFRPQPTYFRIMAKVANDGILKIADTAVELALGLIGVMTLWLGVMKVAEVAGIVTSLAKLVKPVMVRLFPEVPPEHPAMGAMVMNMTANFLGLSNAATPMGLKAMEELNKLNPHAGVATNAMCMFLTINTTAITLIPATVIAIRLTMGSPNPADIIVPTILATAISLVLGVIFTRFIERFYPLPKVPKTPATPVTNA
jgi:spore maturation protein A